MRFVHDASDEVVAEHYRRALVTVLPSVYDDVFGGHWDRPELLGARAAGEPRDRHAGHLHRRRRHARGRPRRGERLHRAAQRPGRARRPRSRGSPPTPRCGAASARPGAPACAPGTPPRARSWPATAHELHACTIATADHLARARVLARSLREHHPDARLHRAVIGDAPAPAEPFEVLGARSASTARRSRRCGAAYELVRALVRAQAVAAAAPARAEPGRPLPRLRPPRLRAARRRFGRRGRHGLVLTRHLLGPLPRDGRHPTEEEILLAGAFNAGFVGVGRDPDARASCAGGRSGSPQDCCDRSGARAVPRPALARPRARPRARRARAARSRASTSASGTCRTGR